MQVFELLSTELLIPPAELVNRIRVAPNCYKVYPIPKRNGESRIIAQPSKSVKMLQRCVVDNILAKLPVHSAALAYRKNFDIKINAARHAKQKYLLKLDFIDFFPSFTAGDFEYYCNKTGAVKSDIDIRILSLILFRRPKNSTDLIMSIGAPSSPVLSNVLMNEFDVRVFDLCKNSGVVYTRYADDLAFSTNEPWILSEIHRGVVELCRSLESPRLQLNPAKTVYTSTKRQRYLTGIILANDGRPSLGRTRRRQIRAAVHAYLLNTGHAQSVESLRGVLAFAHHIEPAFVAGLARKYQSYDSTRLQALGLKSDPN